jgi:hypothetical protein
MVRPWATDEFWDLSQHETVPGAVYVIGRKQYIDNRERVRDMAESGIVQVVMSNPHEGSATLIGQLTHLGLIDLAQQHKISVIGGGDMPSDWPCLQYDKFLPEILDYEENLQAQAQADQIYTKQHKPYKFLFLNGRQRRHRRDLIDKAYIDAGLITDQSFMIDYVNTKKDIDSLGLNLLYLHKHIIIDRNVRWEDQFLNLVELFFNRKDNNNSKSEFINNLIRWRFRHDDHDSKFNIDLNYSLRESAFYDYVKKEIVKAPEIMAELLKFDPIADFELDRKFNNLFKFDNSFILNLVITKYQVLNYVPEKFKDHILINLFAINESITAKQYLHSSYKNNTVFCSLFD